MNDKQDFFTWSLCQCKIGLSKENGGSITQATGPSIRSRDRVVMMRAEKVLLGMLILENKPSSSIVECTATFERSKVANASACLLQYPVL